MTTITAAGSKVYISSVAATASNQTEFEALTWHEIGEITRVGDFGTEYSDISVNTINGRLTQHHKGSYDEGMLDLTVFADPSDEGQTTARTALSDDNNFGIKITLNDSGGTNPSTYYYLGRVMSYRRSVSEVNSMVTASIGIALNTDPVEVAAA